MAKTKTKQVFKQYSPSQNFLLPPNLEELIPSDHLVRIISATVDKMDISAILDSYEGGGTSAYHPRMMVKVLLYGYATKIYTGRRIARALRQDITFMWLAAFNRPDFRTINNFRSGVLKATIEDLFKSMLVFLLEQEYIRFENYFCDGSTFGANANRHKMVWKKNAGRYLAVTEQKCVELFKEIESLNISEDNRYGNKDLEELGSTKQTVSTEQISEQADKLSDIADRSAARRIKRKALSLKRKLEEHRSKIDTYKQQQQLSGSRSGYSKTDIDATAMKMKNDEILPAYNVLIGTEKQFITGYSVHQKTNDGACFKEHLEQLEYTPENIIADSIFGTQENYQLLDDKEISSYMKFPLYHKEQTTRYRNNLFNKDNFSYDTATDTYVCPNNKTLRFRYVKTDRNKNGYISFSRLYECESCAGCPLAADCKKSNDNNRIIMINQMLDAYKEQARQNLKSEKGDLLKRQRGQEVESCFGDIKMNQYFRRFNLRGKSKVKAEFGLVAIAHNMRKIYLQRLKITA